MATTGSTTNFNLSYPTVDDAISLAADMEALATDVDTALLSAGSEPNDAQAILANQVFG